MFWALWVLIQLKQRTQFNWKSIPRSNMPLTLEDRINFAIWTFPSTETYRWTFFSNSTEQRLRAQTCSMSKYASTTFEWSVARFCRFVHGIGAPNDKNSTKNFEVSVRQPRSGLLLPPPPSPPPVTLPSLTKKPRLKNRSFCDKHYLFFENFDCRVGSTFEPSEAMRIRWMQRQLGSGR